MRSNIFDRLSFFVAFFILTLLPIFFLPFANIPIEISKILLLVIGLMIVLILWCLARFFDAKIVLPKSHLILSGVSVVLVLFLSTSFSVSRGMSFFGTMFDIGSFWFIFAAMLLMVVCSIFFRDPKSARIILFGMIIVSAILFIFQTIRLFFPKILSLGVLSGNTASLIGSWNSFGLFAGFAILVMLFVVEFFPTTKLEKIILQLFILLGLFLISAVNFTLIWALLLFVSLVIFMYRIVLFLQEREMGDHGSHFPLTTFIVMMVSVIFLISGSFLGGIVPNRLHIINSEVSPSLSATLSVSAAVLKHKPFLGIGPNRFSDAWALYKPLAINGTQFWDVSFNFGSGLLPTFAATTGYLGILAWLIFFLLFVGSGIRYIFLNLKKDKGWEVMIFFVLALYLFAACFFYSGGMLLVILAFAFTGGFIGLSVSGHTHNLKEISFLNDHRKSFFSILGLLIVIILAIFLAFKFSERFVSGIYFRKAQSTSSISIAEDSMNKALALYTSDLYMRTYAEVYLIKLNSLTQKSAPLSSADKTDLQTNLNKAINGAELATVFDPQNYLNFQMLGSIYQTAGGLGAGDAYDKALSAYQTAANLNPNNPDIRLNIANASFALGNISDAISSADTALSLKPDFVDALIFLSEIKQGQGDTAGALSYAEQALTITPTDQNLIQYIASLKNPVSSTTKTSAKVISKDTSSTNKK